MRDPDRGHVEHGADMERETRTTRMVATGRIHEQDVRFFGEATNHRFEERALAQREQPGLVGGARRSGDACSRAESVAADERCSRPSGIARRSESGLAAFEADEAGAYRRITYRPPPRRFGCRELVLLPAELVRAHGPAAHDDRIAEGGLMAQPADLVAAARAHGVRDSRLLEAIAAIPRARFVSPGLVAHAYEDAPLPIPHDQVTTQPSLVAQMVEALQLSPSERVLEIGTGFGWQTALLARLAGEVWSIERWGDIARTARSHLARHGTENATVVVGDGSGGLPRHAPYDAILVAAAFPRVPSPLIEQLCEGGRLVQPIGLGGADEVVLFVKRGDVLERARRVIGAHFVRLYGEHGFAP